MTITLDNPTGVINADKLDLFTSLQPLLTIAKRRAETGLLLNELVVLAVVIDAAIIRDTPMPMAEVADAASVSRAALTALVDRLENEGYVERVRDQSNRRIIYITPTRKGLQAVTV